MLKAANASMWSRLLAEHLGPTQPLLHCVQCSPSKVPTSSVKKKSYGIIPHPTIQPLRFSSELQSFQLGPNHQKGSCNLIGWELLLENPDPSLWPCLPEFSSFPGQKNMGYQSFHKVVPHGSAQHVMPAVKLTPAHFPERPQAWRVPVVA